MKQEQVLPTASAPLAPPHLATYPAQPLRLAHAVLHRQSSLHSPMLLPSDFRGQPDAPLTSSLLPPPDSSDNFRLVAVDPRTVNMPVARSESRGRGGERGGGLVHA